jgi:hypothetical protein
MNPCKPQSYQSRNEVVICNDRGPGSRRNGETRDIDGLWGTKHAPLRTRFEQIVLSDVPEEVSKIRGLRQFRPWQLVFNIKANLGQGGMASDKVQQGYNATVVAVAYDLEKAEKDLLFVFQMVDLALQRTAATFIGGFIEVAFETALDAVGAGRCSGTLATGVWLAETPERESDIWAVSKSDLPSACESCKPSTRSRRSFCVSGCHYWRQCQKPQGQYGGISGWASCCVHA